MRIPKHWARASYEAIDRDGGTHKVSVCGWSFESLAAAKQAALERAQRLFERVTSGELLGAYEYLDHPIREEIVREIIVEANGSSASTPLAIITRNRYGALVLNTAEVMFVDIDFSRTVGGGLIETILLVFSRAKRRAKRQQTIDAAIARVRDWAHRNPRRSFRLYRTLDGLRLLFIDQFYQPNSPPADTTLAELDADPMYVKLTQKQECFRARLTVKPWRCGLGRPPHLFPWESDTKQNECRQWQSRYDERDVQHKVCELIEQFGSGVANDVIRTIVTTHDEACRIDAALPLA